MIQYMEAATIRPERNNDMDNQKAISLKINDLEKKYHFVFPESLRKFYFENDCSALRPFSFIIDNYECGFAKMIPLISDGLSFEKIVDDDRTEGFIPSSYYPIARDRGGNLYYWDATTEKVYYVLNDDIEDPFLVFQDLDDFLNCIQAHQLKQTQV